MTIRIHEADGTPYEHIVDIKSASMTVEITYNTKYKRLKRNRRQRDHLPNAPGMDDNMDAQDDSLLYCLGDVLLSQEEMTEWRLIDWSKEDNELEIKELCAASLTLRTRDSSLVASSSCGENISV